MLAGGAQVSAKERRERGAQSLFARDDYLYHFPRWRC